MMRPAGSSTLLRVDSFAPRARQASAEGRGGIVHFEVDKKNLNKIVTADQGVVGDLAVNLKYLMGENDLEAKPRTEWYGQIDNWEKT